MLLLLGTNQTPSNIGVSPSAMTFTEQLKTPTVAVVTGGLPPYTATTSDTNYANVTQAISQNLYPNSDTLSDSTFAGVVKANGGPNGATDAEYTGNGSLVGANQSLSRVIPVTMGQTYTLSDWIDPSQVTNNAGSMPNIGTEFAGSTQNADGSYSNVDGKSSATKYTLTSGAPFAVGADIARGSTSAVVRVLIGDTTNGYGIICSGGNIAVSKFVSGSESYPGGLLSYVPDLNFHSLRVSVTPGSPNSIEVRYGATIITTTDSGLTLTSGTWPITIQTGGASGSIKNYTVNPQIALGLNTADNLTQILQQYVALNTTTAGRYATAAWTCPTNTVPNSDDLAGAWTQYGTWSFGTNGPGGAKSVEVAGTGSAFTSQQFWNNNAAVTSGTERVGSVWVDASQVTSGTASLNIFKDSTQSQLLATASISAGFKGRISTGSFVVPSGITDVQFDCDAGNAVVPVGQTLKFSQPMLEPASVASGYYISSQNPQVHVYAELLSSAIVATGQKFKISQPMLRTDGVIAPYESPTSRWIVSPTYPGQATVTFQDSTTATATATVTFIGNPSYPDLLKVGSVNRKALAFIGLSNDAEGTYQSVIYPQGTFMLSDTTGKTQIGEVTQTARGYDLSREFSFEVYGGLPHPLYGRQNDVRYDSNYNLKNPSGDNKTFICDGKFFMKVPSDNPFMASAFSSVFNGSTAPASGVNVYVGTPTSPSSTIVDPSTYTWDSETGTVVFNTAQVANAVVSVDGVPQGMAPETMMQHLFYDYGGYDPSNFRFDTTNIVLPAYIGGGGKTVWDIAQDIANATAPRAVKWRLRTDEYANILFYEDKYADQPTETLVDERDFLTLSYTQTDDQLSNVVRAQASANNEQQITSISYDIDSISDNGERKTDDISSKSFLSLRGLPPLQVKSFLDAATAVELHDKSRPMVEIQTTLLANPARQVGDKVTVIERSNGLSGPYIVKGITDTLQEGIWTQDVRLQAVKLYANYNMGLPSAITNGAAPGTTGDITNQQINVSGRTSIIKTVVVNNATVIVNGGQAYDKNNNAVIPVLTNGAWTFQFTLDPTQQYDTVVHQFLFFECPNTLSSSDIMAIKLQNWLTNDGVVISAANVGAGYTQTSTHSTGTSLGAGENAYLYSSLVYPAYTNSLSPYYASKMTTLNWVASTGLSGAVGVGLGQSYTGNYAWLPQAKYNFGFFVIMAYNAAGATSILRLPVIISA